MKHMQKYTITLLKKEEVATGTMSFLLSRPEGFVFKAGQHIDLTIPNPPENDDEGNVRTFSLASAPEEEGLLVATRMRDTAFKRVLKSMPEGSALEMDGPYGNMILQSNTSRPAVFLAGGIGITPFRSMIFEAALKGLPHKIFLFYSNRKIEDAAFLAELRALEKKNENYKLITTLTAPEAAQSGKSDETGYITEAMVRKYIPDFLSPVSPRTERAVHNLSTTKGGNPLSGVGVYYLAGPPAMTGAMREMLSRSGVSEDDIRMEEFSGY